MALDGISIPPEEIEITAMRAQGAGGQNVNKVSSAIQLRFDIAASSLPEDHKQRLLRLHDRRITKEGVLIIKAQELRTQEGNRMAALRRLEELVESVARAPKVRKPTRPSAGAHRKRLEFKTRRGELKAARSKAAVEV